MPSRIQTNYGAQSLSFVPFSTDENFINNESDPDVNFYNDIFTLDAQSIDNLAPDKFQRNFKPFSKQSLSILHLNIRSINKNFEAFNQFYLFFIFNSSIVLSLETWADNINRKKNSSFQLPNYNNEHQIRKSARGRGVCIFIHDSLDYKVRKDLSINHDAIESQLETRYLMSSTGLQMETQKSANSFVKIYFLKIVKS